MTNHLVRVKGSKLMEQKGQGLVEYALILVLIAIVVIVGITTLGTSISNTFTTINTNIGQ